MSRRVIVRIERPGALAVERGVEGGRDVDDVMALVRTALRDELHRRPADCVAIVLAVHRPEGCEHG